jgi:pimeloyl-ACP methyl ester carboxylesterase
MKTNESLNSSLVEKPTIIFVHGIWADASSWSAQITALQAQGYSVISVQNPVSSLADDVAAVKRAISLAEGNVILVAHSWGGFVITQAGHDPKVVGLVYIAAVVPDLGETLVTLQAKGPEVPLPQYFVPVDGYVYLSKEGIKKAFAQDLSPEQQDLVYATQTPGSLSVLGDESGEPAWKNKPSWYVIATADGALHVDLQRFLVERSNSKSIELDASHLVMISHPDEVTQIIEEAANAII